MKSNIKHYLVIYDGETEEVEELIYLERANLEDLKNILDVMPSDPEMHDRYAVGPDEIETIATYFDKKIEYDFSKYAYFVEAISD